MDFGSILYGFRNVFDRIESVLGLQMYVCVLVCFVVRKSEFSMQSLFGERLATTVSENHRTLPREHRAREPQYAIVEAQ